MDALTHTILTIWDFLYNFLVIGVLGYLAKRWIADKIVEKWIEWKTKTPRTLAIWEHFDHRHGAENILDCSEGRCTVLQNAS